MNDWMILVQVQVQVMSKFGDAEVGQVFAIGYMDKSSGIDYQEFVSMMVPNSVATINSDCQITRNEMKNGMDKVFRPNKLQVYCPIIREF